MLTITPIQSKKYEECKQTSHPRPVFTQKQDAFERTNISFKGGVDLHLPVREIEELFERTYEALIKESDNIKKYKLTKECTDSLRKLQSKRDGGNLHCDRDHEIANQLYTLVKHSSDLIRGKVPNNQYDHNLFKRSATNVMAVVKRYELFLEKGLDKGTMPPIEVFKIAHDYANEYAKGKGVNILVEGEELLSKHQDGISMVLGSRLEDYQWYTIPSNLMQNGVKYAKDGSTVNVKLAEQAIDGKKFLTVSVRDEGIGIPKEEQKKVLEGERAQNAIDSGIQGTGYGLRRVKNLIKDFQGREVEPIQINSPLYPENIQYPGAEITAYLRLKD